MPSITYKNAQLVVNAVDLSSNLTSLTLNYEAESLDESHMGVNSRIHKGGLKNWSLDAIFLQNFACVDATLFGLVGCQTSAEWRACNACSSAGNPQFEGTLMLQSAPPLAGAVGALLVVNARFESAGDLRHCAAAS